MCQNSIERALANRDKWQAGTRLDSWMYRMMRNIWIDEVRARSRRGETFVDEEAGLGIGLVVALALLLARSGSSSTAVTLAIGAVYYVAVRLLEVYVWPRLGVLLGSRAAPVYGRHDVRRDGP